MNLQQAFEYYRQETAAVSAQILQLLAPQWDRPLSAVDQRWRQEQMACLLRRQADAMTVLLSLRGLGTPRRERTEGGSTHSRTPATDGPARISANIEASEVSIAGASGLAFRAGSARSGATEQLSAAANFGSSEDVPPSPDQPRTDGGGDFRRSEESSLHRNAAHHQDETEHASPEGSILPSPSKNAEVAPRLINGYEGLSADMVVSPQAAGLKARADSDIPAAEVQPPAPHVSDLQDRSDGLSPSQADDCERGDVDSDQASSMPERLELLPRPIIGAAPLSLDAVGDPQGAAIRALRDGDSVEAAREDAGLRNLENSFTPSEASDSDGIGRSCPRRRIECASQGEITEIGRAILEKRTGRVGYRPVRISRVLDTRSTVSGASSRAKTPCSQERTVGSKPIRKIQLACCGGRRFPACPWRRLLVEAGGGNRYCGRASQSR